MLATVVRQENLTHLDRTGVARLMEESARHTGDSERLSADIRQATDLMREAHYWARHQNGKELIGAEEVQQAIDGRIRRASRYRDRMQEEMIRRHAGSRDIRAPGSDKSTAWPLCSLVALRSPVRSALLQRSPWVRARSSILNARWKLGGPLHSKGVLILAGFLSSHYVTDQPLSLSASLVFEQSYGGVEGDSASAGELCVLASALAEIPIKQSLAVTGSIDQHGRIQAIGGVNEKIEGFFDICSKRGLSGDQGVLIPVANVKHLMLRRDVIEAVEAGQFHVYPVDHVDLCLELLTGLPAGEA